MHFDRHIRYWATHRRDFPYMTFGDRTITWGELDSAADELAGWLSEAGVGPGDRFGVLLRNSLEWCVGFAAAIRLGAIMVPLNALFGTFELGQIARDADCTAILSCPEEIAKLGVEDNAPAGRVAVYDMCGDRDPEPLDAILGSGRSAPRTTLSEDDILAICYTSGTTGVPKGIALSHRAVDTMCLRVGLRYGWEAGEERFLVLAPLAFTGGIISMLATQISIGASGWLVSQVDPAGALDMVVRHRITYFAGVPALWERIASAPGFADADLSYLRTAATGGAPVSVELLKAFLAKGVVIRQNYGVSENCGTVCCPDREGATSRPGSCGPPLPGVDVEVRDDDGRALPPGEIGEICVRSPQLMDCYWSNPEATAASFDDGWYKTGDLGYFDDHGGLVIADRKKNMLISGGVNIYPAEIEHAMMQVDGIVEVAVFGLPSESWGQEVAAIVYAPSLSDAGEVRRQMRELIGSMKAPKHVAFHPTPLPKTASDKIARHDLVGLFQSVQGQSAANAAS